MHIILPTKNTIFLKINYKYNTYYHKFMTTVLLFSFFTIIIIIMQTSNDKISHGNYCAMSIASVNIIMLLIE